MQEISSVATSEPKVLNGRLYFPNIESVHAAYLASQNKSEDQLATQLDALDFQSLRPIITENNLEKNLSVFISRVSASKKATPGVGLRAASITPISDEDILDSIDDLEDIIGDDVFGAFLNQNGEIQVAEDIYKYTDVGLFKTDVENYPNLISYLDNRQISLDMLRATDPQVKTAYIQENASDNGDFTTVGPHLNYFVIPLSIAPEEPNFSGGGGTYVPPKPKDEDPSTFLKNLSSCSPRGGAFGNLFGENLVCIDKYESKYRVKTKAYNSDYKILTVSGVKVKHQKKGVFGIWHKTDADEIRIGADAIQYFFDYGALLPSANDRERVAIYTRGQMLYYLSTPFWNNLQGGIPTITGYDMNNLPRLFRDDIVIAQTGSKSDLIGATINLANSLVTSDRLNKYFWETTMNELEKAWQKIGQPKPVSLEQKSKITLLRTYPEEGKLFVQKVYFQSKLNADKLERIVDVGG